MSVFPANTTLQFKAPADNARIGFDGTPEIKTEDYIVIASLKSRTAVVTLPAKMADSDDSEILLEGRSVFPEALPNWLLPGSKAIAHMWRIESTFRLPDAISAATLDLLLKEEKQRITQTGIFFLKGAVGSRFRVQEILGDKIEGRLFLNVAWAREV